MVPIANKMARLCPEAIGSTRFPFIVAQLRSSAVTAMSTSAGRTIIPDSDSDGKPYYYSDIDEVHKPSEPSSEPSSREGSVQRLRSALNAASVIPLDGVDIASELPPFGESDSDSGNGSESEQGSGRDSDPASHSEWSGFDTDDNYPTSEDEAIPNPPPTITAASIEDLQAAVNAWAKDKGFAVMRKNGRGKKNGAYTRYNLLCDRFSQPRPSKSAGLR